MTAKEYAQIPEQEGQKDEEEKEGEEEVEVLLEPTVLLVSGGGFI